MSILLWVWVYTISCLSVKVYASSPSGEPGPTLLPVLLLYILIALLPDLLLGLLTALLPALIAPLLLAPQWLYL